MGKINRGSGILGGFSGTVGTVVGSNWRGIETMRAVPKPKKGTPTQAQIDQQLKFGVAVKFIAAKRNLLETGFRNFAVEMTGTNSALSHTVMNAITGVSPNFSIDYSKVLLTKGNMPAPQNAVGAAGAAATVAFTWLDNSISGGASATDIAILIAYCEALNTSIYTLAGPQRSAAAGVLAVPGLSGKTVQTWMAFISTDGKRLSNSVFTGQVAVV